MLKGIITQGTVITVDQEIELIEQLVETNRAEQMLTICVERFSPEILKVHTMTLGCPLDRARDVLLAAVESIDAMIGKKP